ncbi:MAG: peptide deformylase [Saprospiraceae bacterium]|jgi:peptide deformylase|nr:peptide deformylase [Saprospiraceae bacterium]MBL0024470.1 peptide deformylase [Saprospiraceae bacterium]
MILPVYVLGQPVLKKKANEIDKDYPDLGDIIANMWDTMYDAHGVGIAAPQIGLSIRVFVIDTIQVMEDDKREEGIRKVFINAVVVEETGDYWTYEEGCLSIPNIKGDVDRPQKVRIQYMDEHFNKYDEIYEGINARVIQHEYDHIEGILFIEKLKPLKKKLIQRKLKDIKAGNAIADYKIKSVRV